MNKLKKLFLTELADRYDSEQRLLPAMAKMAKLATCAHLKKLIQFHIKETEDHVRQVERVFKSFGEKARARKCEATIGLLKEGAKMADKFKDTPASNAALVSVAQKIENYEIASYGCLRDWATLLGNKEAADLLQSVLEEERAANEALIKLAHMRSNKEALGDYHTNAERDWGRKNMESPKVAGRSRSVTVRRMRPASLKM